MKKTVCNYVAIRFRPFADNGEFVNIGVAAQFPEIPFFGFRIVKRMTRRIRSFFPEVDHEVFKAGIEAVTQQMKFYRESGLFDREQSLRRSIAESPVAFELATRSREGMIFFSPVRTRITHRAALIEITKLYAAFVDRRFEEPLDQVSAMNRDISLLLKQSHYSRYFKRNALIGDRDYHVQMPFVQFQHGEPVKAIKPFDLAKPDVKSIFDQADVWLPKLKRLRDRDALPSELVFPIYLPHDPAQAKAARQVVDELVEFEVKPVSVNDRAALLELMRPINYREMPYD